MEQWEGGIRVNGWVSGGFLPDKVRGTKYEGLACGWDWCKCWAPSTTPVSVTIALLIACLACAHRQDLSDELQPHSLQFWPCNYLHASLHVVHILQMARFQSSLASIRQTGVPQVSTS